MQEAGAVVSTVTTPGERHRTKHTEALLTFCTPLSLWESALSVEAIDKCE